MGKLSESFLVVKRFCHDDNYCNLCLKRKRAVDATVKLKADRFRTMDTV